MKKLFSSEFFVFFGGKVCHHQKIVKYAHSMNDFLRLIHREAEQTLKRKIFWKDIRVEKIFVQEDNGWKFLEGPGILSEIRYGKTSY